MHDDEGYLLGDEGDDPADPGETHWTDLVVLCAHCLLERYPAAGRGMDLARQGGLACYSQGAWYIQQGDDAA